MKEYCTISGFGKISDIFILNITYPAGYVANLKTGTPADTMIIILSGRVSCEIPGCEAILLDSGSITYFTKNQKRMSAYLTETHLLSIHINSSSAVFSSVVRQVKTDRLNSFQRECLNNIIETVNGDTTVANYTVLSSVLGLLDCCDCGFGRDVPEKYRSVYSVKVMIDEDFIKDTKISEYAKKAAMSESTLRRLFHEYMGCSPMNYRIILRLKYAQMLLMSGECNISEAAQRSGFNSLPYFCRQYKNKYGDSAGNMTKNHRF